MFRPALVILATVFLTSVRAAGQAEWPFDLTTISAPDGSVTAKFVSFGATLTELWVKDRQGGARDVVLGYDDNASLAEHQVYQQTVDRPRPSSFHKSILLFRYVLKLTDLCQHNPVVGRYANRIKNGTFSIPITKTAQLPGPGVYKIPTNDHNGEVTLHGGIYGWDRRNWTLVSKSPTSVTYKHLDAGDEGFPGNVTAYVTHTVSTGGVYNAKVFATATELTPIMLTQHIYWNLDAFQDGTDDILSHHLQIDSSKVAELDGDAVPTGKFTSAPGTPFDFRQEQTIGARWNNTVDLCGGGCQGYDSCWIYDHNETSRTGTALWSDKSGIRVDISTNQPAVQVYTSFWLNTTRKEVHGGPSLKYSRWSAVAIEQQGYVDAINTPEWGVDQIYGPNRDFTWSSTYKFSVVR